MGTYGFLRFSLPLLPETAKNPWVVNVMAVLSIIGIVYGALASLMQKDWKKLVAYSSVSHLGFCTLGIFTLNPMGISGSILQQINHGISTGMLFLIVGIVYERRHTREISEYGGLLKVMPVFTMVFLIAALSSMGMPPLNGFIGEFTILQGAYQMSINWAIWCSVGIALGAAYLLWLFQRTMLGNISGKNEKLLDLSWREIAVFAPLIVWAFWIAVPRCDRAPRSANCRARAARLLCRAQADQSTFGVVASGGAALIPTAWTGSTAALAVWAWAGAAAITGAWGGAGGLFAAGVLAGPIPGNFSSSFTPIHWKTNPSVIEPQKSFALTFTGKVSERREARITIAAPNVPATSHSVFWMIVLYGESGMLTLNCVSTP
jgi:NADH:ubiquinone oxidoreductase subunit 5 (subunit L)/multisubunit Na+/H+ antiporter MnhA subunit